MSNPTKPSPAAAPSVNDLLAEVARLQAANDKMRLDATRAQPAMTIAVSAKGAVSVYGMGRFPVSLYKGQWRKLASKMAEIVQFIDEGEAQGALAPDDKEAAFVQPNNLPLKFRAKQASTAPSAKVGSKTSAL